MILYLVPIFLIAGLFSLGLFRIYSGPYQKWPLFYQMLAKWALITVICGAYSFVLGMMVSNFRFIPMLAAMGVTAFGLAWFESRQIVGGIKERFPLLRRAMKYGTRLRLFWALLGGVGQFFMAVPLLRYVFIAPPFVDMTIGQVVVVGFKLIGFDLERVSGGFRDSPESRGRVAALPDYPEWVSQLGVFGVSLTTAAIHVMILGLIVLLIWGVMSLYVSLRRGKPT